MDEQKRMIIKYHSWVMLVQLTAEWCLFL
jgi:hypothetical protein